MELSSKIWTLILIAVFFHESARGENSGAVKELVTNNNLVSHQLYNVLRETTPGNILFSPLSLRTVMAMLEAGARGSTKWEIERSMRFPENEEDLYNGYYSLINQLKENRNSNSTIKMANRIYVKKGIHLQNNFEKIQERYFKSALSTVDFSKSREAAKEINDWVSQKTTNKIKNLINPGILNNRTRLVLVNALLFKGLWENRFFPKQTKKLPFYLNSARAVDVDMMSTEHYFRFGDLTQMDAKAIILPYEFDYNQNPQDSFQMIIIVPNQVSGIRSLEDKITNTPPTEIIRSIPERPKNIALTLPKFKIESSFDLIEPMRKLGMKIIFDEDNADFSGITTLGKLEPLHVSQLVQKCTLSTDENGSEAAAATFAAVFTPYTIGPSIEEELTVDRPFIGYIYDAKTNTVLFMFRINNL